MYIKYDALFEVIDFRGIHVSFLDRDNLSLIPPPAKNIEFTNILTVPNPSLSTFCREEIKHYLDTSEDDGKTEVSTKPKKQLFKNFRLKKNYPEVYAPGNHVIKESRSEIKGINKVITYFRQRGEKNKIKKAQNKKRKLKEKVRLKEKKKTLSKFRKTINFLLQCVNKQGRSEEINANMENDCTSLENFPLARASKFTTNEELHETFLCYSETSESESNKSVKLDHIIGKIDGTENLKGKERNQDITTVIHSNTIPRFLHPDQNPEDAVIGSRKLGNSTNSDVASTSTKKFTDPLDGEIDEEIEVYFKKTILKEQISVGVQFKCFSTPINFGIQEMLELVNVQRTLSNNKEGKKQNLSKSSDLHISISNSTSKTLSLTTKMNEMNNFAKTNKLGFRMENNCNPMKKSLSVSNMNDNREENFYMSTVTIKSMPDLKLTLDYHLQSNMPSITDLTDSTIPKIPLIHIKSTLYNQKSNSLPIITLAEFADGLLSDDDIDACLAILPIKVKSLPLLTSVEKKVENSIITARYMVQGYTKQEGVKRAEVRLFNIKEPVDILNTFCANVRIYFNAF